MCIFSAIHAFTIILRFVALRLRGGRHEFFVVRFLLCACLVNPPSRMLLVQFSLVFSALEDKQRVLHKLTSFLHRLVNAFEHTWCSFLCSLTVREYADHTGVKVESLQISRHLQNLRHLLSTARRTGFFPICSSPFAEVAHEKFGLVFFVVTFPLQAQGLKAVTLNVIFPKDLGGDPSDGPSSLWTLREIQLLEGIRDARRGRWLLLPVHWSRIKAPNGSALDVSPATIAVTPGMATL